ncbi:hypothetical protein M0R45_009641 [Rubus argutus]|uniref:Uncharacterized protein n=1 Tax=Rubus argutus TaxID=59490 RepID=A0AAW1Y498_RUBAR
MKRKIMDQSKGSEIRSAIEELSVMVKVIGVMALQDENGGDHDAAFIKEEAAHIPTKPFLSLCTILGFYGGVIAKFSRKSRAEHEAGSGRIL